MEVKNLLLIVYLASSLILKLRRMRCDVVHPVVPFSFILLDFCDGVGDNRLIMKDTYPPPFWIGRN